MTIFCPTWTARCDTSPPGSASTCRSAGGRRLVEAATFAAMRRKAPLLVPDPSGGTERPSSLLPAGSLGHRTRPAEHRGDQPLPPPHPRTGPTGPLGVAAPGG